MGRDVVDVQLVRRLALVLLEVLDDVGDIQERIALQTEVHERRLHPRQHLRHPALVDVADDGPVASPLDPELDDLTLVENCDPRLVPGVLFSNWPMPEGSPQIQDLAPTILSMFGIGKPDHMTGRVLPVQAPAGV